jgi:hypothetical protein
MAWNPDDPAVFVQLSPSGLAVSLVRHDGYPYQEDWNETATGWNGLFAIANRYLALANRRLNLPQEWLDDLTEESSGGDDSLVPLRWLRDAGDPRHSYWAERQTGLDEAARPETGPIVCGPLRSRRPSRSTRPARRPRRPRLGPAQRRAPRPGDSGQTGRWGRFGSGQSRWKNFPRGASTRS